MTKQNCTTKAEEAQQRKIKGARLTQSQFLKKMHDTHPDLDFSKAKYENAKTKVEVVCMSHGTFWKAPNKLDKQGCPKCGRERGRKKRVVTFSEFVKRAQEVHGNRYKYIDKDFAGTGTGKRVWALCKEHGWFNPLVKVHLSGHKCLECTGATRWNFEKFVAKAAEVHKGRFQYPTQEFKAITDKVTVICPSHGAYQVTADSHIHGANCKKCAHLNGIGFGRSDFIQNCTERKREPVTYIIELTRGAEKFYKVGITSETVEERFRHCRLPYRIKTMYEVKGGPDYVYDLEKQLHKILIEHRYEPRLKFNGYTECFNTIKPIEKLLKELTQTDQLQLIA